MGKKNIDKLFQEKFSNFSEAPDEKVWQSINTSLDKKKKSRKIIPLWWKFGGVAAILVIGLFIANPFKEVRNIDSNVTEIETQKNKTDSELKEQEVIKELEKTDTEIVDIPLEAPLEKGITFQENGAETSHENTEEGKKKSSGFKSSAATSTIQIATTTTSDAKPKLERESNVKPYDENNMILKKNTNEAIAVQITTKSNNSIENKTMEETSGETSIQKSNLSIEKQTGIARAEKAKTVSEEIDSKKKSIFDEIAEQEKEKEVLAENKGGKWSAGPSVAPVYFDAIGEGSPVHSIFVPNSKSGDLNLSYGLSVAYEVNSKLKIRSGIHRVDYGYSTNDVEFSSSLESSAIGQIANVNYSATGRNIVVASSASEAAVNTPNELVTEDFSGQGLSQNGSMTQQFGYLEVPVELEYALVDKKLGVNLIGGISSLFLVDNAISLSSGELITEMGEANNVNEVNFSTNVGIGLNYKFTKKVQLNIEPVFKYQLNTFSQTDGTFQPFTVGVYSGVSYKF